MRTGLVSVSTKRSYQPCPLSLITCDKRLYMFYVYIHLRLDTGEIFYVGKGSKKRAWSYQHRSQWWKSLVGKTGRSVHLWKTKLTEEQAYKEEANLIGFLKGEGYRLVNITSGGLGGWTCTRSEEVCKKLSEAAFKRWETRDRSGLRGARNGMYGKTHSPEHRAKLAEFGRNISPEKRARLSQRFSGVNNPRYGVTFSKETRRKISLALKGKPRPRGEECPASKLTDELVLAIYRDRRSLEEVKQSYNISKSVISNIRNGKRWTHVTQRS